MDDDGNMKLIHAYPEGEERQIINQCMDEYIRELREKNLLHEFINGASKGRHIAFKIIR